MLGYSKLSRGLIDSLTRVWLVLREFWLSKRFAAVCCEEQPVSLLNHNHNLQPQLIDSVCQFIQIEGGLQQSHLTMR